jgi:hypothetical protein
MSAQPNWLTSPAPRRTPRTVTEQVLLVLHADWESMAVALRRCPDCRIASGGFIREAALCPTHTAKVIEAIR